MSLEQTIHHPQRILQINGSHNFRDLGGYPTSDGQQTRWRAVFRCAHFANTSDTGWTRLAQLDIKWLIDLREANECHAAPTHWAGSPPPQTLLAPRSAGAYDNRQMLAFEPGMDLAQARARRVSAYTDKVLGFKHAVAALFQVLANGEPGALAFHCMAGKDRTGFLAAVLLTWLGVGREYVIADYLLTRDTAKDNVSMDKAKGLLALYGLENAGPDALKAMTEVIPECIVAALDDIEQNHGGIAAYVASASMLPEASFSAIRQRLLESAE